MGNDARKAKGAAAPTLQKMVDAAKGRTSKAKRGGILSVIPGGMLSVGALLVAVATTVLLTRSPPQAPPRAPGDVVGTEKPKDRKAQSDSDDPYFKPQDRKAQCDSWAKDGECENNAPFMLERCPTTCSERAKKKAPPKKAPPEKKSGLEDKDPNCGVWAASGECDKNPVYMKDHCAAACSGESSEVLQDLNQDCEAWVGDGECYRNPAFMLQQCRASCGKFASENENILQDTSDECVNFALTGGCTSEPTKASTKCRASCHIQRICANHTETTTCSRALRCEALGDHKSDCEARAKSGECAKQPMKMLKECLKSCSEHDLEGMMRFHLPHVRTTLSTLIDLPGVPPRLAGFYATPPQSTNADPAARAITPAKAEGFARRLLGYADQARHRQRWNRYHWSRCYFTYSAKRCEKRTPRVPHRFTPVPRELGAPETALVEHVQFSPRIRYIHRLLSAEECEHVLKLSLPRFSRSPVRGSVTRVRTSTTAMLGGRLDDAVVKRIRARIARFSGFPVDHLEPLQVVRYERGQKYEGHHDYFDVCDLEDKTSSGRRQVTFLIYLVDMPPGEEGGGTSFPDLNLEVRPEQGSAIVFNDCHDWGGEDGRSLHAGQPPVNPDTVKYAINGWIRSQ
ncbi:procollagen-proline dioxygenase [Chrysochromulina tobinii]|uniref:Procollagen-proline dioxygenase n=1 Tax=Chrysochromulina tobinii TaxID=1460289 RepID=A0A0M0JU98_9EUKA|nr:procollagen-proline dioxygenase [Chrysochromulina tobinii]|eukprot:KOO30129.1 procollagen-proline dioxygenase [Chrysochromulina sp. CCMP291]